MTVRVSLADLRALETIAPDPRSTTKFAPFVSMPPEWRDALVAAVEAAQAYDAAAPLGFYPEAADKPAPNDQPRPA